jgi:glutathione synthase
MGKVMKHLIFLDSLDKLVIKKDSTLLLALRLVEQGHDVGLMFEEDFYVSNDSDLRWKVYQFKGSVNEQNFHLNGFELTSDDFWQASDIDYFHMRLDPPFDTRYLRFLWMQRELVRFKMKIVNDPHGILIFNEKLKAYSMPGALESYVGASVENALTFCRNIAEQSGKAHFILKPLDLFQGIGVIKFELSADTKDLLTSKILEYGGAVVIQPYEEKVEEGEVRSIFYGTEEIGTILKVPKKGDFLSNIAQGASYHQVELSALQRERCLAACKELAGFGVPWIAFDILGDALSEINITCPGLLVEVSDGIGANCADKIISLMN